MKAICLSNKSWHYRLARFGDPFKQRNLSDICCYTRALMIGSLLLLGASTLCLILLWSLGDLIAWIATMIVMQTFINMSPMATLSSGGILGMLFVGILSSITDKRKNRPAEQQGPGFVSVAYYSWKDKWCAPVIVYPAETANDQETI